MPFVLPLLDRTAFGFAPCRSDLLNSLKVVAAMCMASRIPPVSNHVFGRRWCISGQSSRGFGRDERRVLLPNPEEPDGFGYERVTDKAPNHRQLLPPSGKRREAKILYNSDATELPVSAGDFLFESLIPKGNKSDKVREKRTPCRKLLFFDGQQPNERSE
jgi:hypothetical protein